MKRPFLLLSALAALTAAPALWAQEAEQPPAETTEETQADTPVPGGDLDLGEDATPAPGQNYIKETFTDWALQCFRTPQNEEVCQMYQLLKEDGGASVAEVSMFRLAEGGQVVAGGAFVVPLETLLTAKLTIQVDNGQARQYDYAFCNQVGCVARVGFTAADIASFKAGNVAKVTLVPALAPDQKVQVEMSLSGFTAAFDAVSALAQ